MTIEELPIRLRRASLMYQCYYGDNNPIYIRYIPSMTGRGAWVEKDGEVVFEDTIQDIEVYSTQPDYDSYIKSQVWLERRNKYFQTHEKRCYMCGSTQNIQLHHKTYERVGREPDDDLEPLCAECHKKVHEFVESLQYLKDGIQQGIESIKHEYEVKMREEIKQRTENYLQRALPRIQRAAQILPRVIGNHKPHAAALIRDTLGLDISSQILIKSLKTK